MVINEVGRYLSYLGKVRQTFLGIEPHAISLLPTYCIYYALTLDIIFCLSDKCSLLKFFRSPIQRFYYSQALESLGTRPQIVRAVPS